MIPPGQVRGRGGGHPEHLLGEDQEQQELRRVRGGRALEGPALEHALIKGRGMLIYSSSSFGRGLECWPISPTFRKDMNSIVSG